MGRTRRGLTEWLADFGRLVMPPVCVVCHGALSRGEDFICLDCLANLPRTGIHGDGFNALHQRLAGRTPIQRTAAMFYYYTQSLYADLIHEAKYNERPSIARKLARLYATELLKDNFFNDIDLLLPVPIHPWKKIVRGYNQTEHIAMGIHDATGIKIGDNLIVKRGHTSQTRKSAYDRWLNSRGIYMTKSPASLAGLHVLIIDDVITTGATLLACADAIHDTEPSALISVLTLGATHLR